MTEPAIVYRSLDPEDDYAPPLQIIQREQERIYDLCERKRYKEAFARYLAMMGAVAKLGLHLSRRMSEGK